MCGAVQVPVMVHEHIDNATEEIRLLGTEETSCNLVDGLLQLRDTVIVFRSIISVVQIIIMTIRRRKGPQPTAVSHCTKECFWVMAPLTRAMCIDG